MDAIRRSSGSSLVRIFDASECDVAAQTLPAAKSKGFQAVLGIWPENEAQYSAGKKAIVTNKVKYREQIHAITVGSESLYRSTYTAYQLVSRLKDMRRAAP
ncbi:glycoside hydrolase 3 protein [Amphichorda felina]